MRGAPAWLGGVSAFLGFFPGSFMVFGYALVGYTYNAENGPPIPISVTFLVLCSFIGSVVAQVAAFEIKPHRIVGSTVMLAGGLLPFLGLLLVVIDSAAQGYEPFPATGGYSAILGFLILLWWAWLVVIAGVLGLLNLPSKQRRNPLLEEIKQLEENERESQNEAMPPEDGQSAGSGELS